MVKTRAQRRKQMIAESWDKVESAQGVFIDILSRVSVKSIRSFKTISKHWYGSISNKYFSKQQLIQSRKNPSFITCPAVDSKMRLYSMKAGSFKLSPLKTFDPSERGREGDMYMISSFNGLICCVNQIFDEDVESKFYNLQIWICNPCTGDFLLLPQGRPSIQFEPCVGVVVGSDMSDYRVFRIFSTGIKPPEESISGKKIYYPGGRPLAYEGEVYTSSTGFWKNIGPVPCAPMRTSVKPYNCDHVSVGGKVYWLASLDEPGQILSLDLEGRFDVIDLLKYSKHLRSEDQITEATFLVNLQESLALIVFHAEDMDIWVWKKDGKEYDWMLEYVDGIPIENDEVVLAVTSFKNQIVYMTETHWCTYNVDTGIWKRKRGPRTLVYLQCRFVNPTLLPFTESLLPCNGGVRL